MLKEVTNYRIVPTRKTIADTIKAKKKPAKRVSIILNPNIFKRKLTGWSYSPLPNNRIKIGTVDYTYKTKFTISKERFLICIEKPIRLGEDKDIPSKIYWLYGDKLYLENDGLDVDSIKALIDAKKSKNQRKVEFLKGPERKEKSRQFIEDDVKIAVWRRDNARCVKCGSNKDLEFDHIIPVSMGGSSTERNLQLLCERCNREKGADLK